MFRRLRLGKVGYAIIGALFSAVLFPYLNKPFFVPILDTIDSMARQYPYLAAGFALLVAMLVFATVWALIRMVDLRSQLHVLQTEAIGLKKHVEFAKIQARTDPKTGIPNSEALAITLNDAIKKVHENEDVNIVVAYIDLNSFGAANRAYGSRFGDVLISCFASTVQARMRRDETIARRPAKADQVVELREVLLLRASELFRRNTGGDEFVFVLEETIPGGVGFIKSILEKTMPKVEAEALREAKSRLALQIDSVRIGFCAGITLIEKSDSADSVLDWAEHLMWDAKNMRSAEAPDECVIVAQSRSSQPTDRRQLVSSVRDQRGAPVWEERR